MNNARTRRGLLAAALIALLSPILSACGADEDSAGRPAALRTAANGDVFNQADVDFAQQMIPHHAQAVEMVDLTRNHTLDPVVRRLTEQIRDAQVPEIQTMVAWLDDWDEKVPPTSTDHAHADMGGMKGMGHGGDALPGMMSAEDMEKLGDAEDPAFQEMWLTMMIAHHEGAIEMAQEEIADGAFGPALDLARNIQRSQQQEVDTMRSLLG